MSNAPHGASAKRELFRQFAHPKIARRVPVCARSCFPQPLPPRNRWSNWPTMVQSGPHRHRRGPVKEVMTPEERPPGPGGPPFKSWSTMLNVATSNLESRGGELGGETELKASGLDP